jgi:hypothetical protein
MTEQSWYGGSTPIVFLRPIGIAAGDAMRLMELAKRPARWRMAPPGVAADAYLVHRHSILNTDASMAPTVPTPSSNSAWMASYSGHSQSSAMRHARKISLDHQGWHRGRPVCILGQGIDTQGLDEDELAPLSFPDALVELERGLEILLRDLVGSRMLYNVGSLAWEQRHKWATHHLHAIESGQLIAMIDPQAWQFYLLDGCSVERMAEADMVAKPRTVGFSAPGFHQFKLEVALWEFAKRCPEHLLEQILPASYLLEPLTHRRTPHLKESALGDHCVAILRALDTRSRTADELQSSLRLTRASLMRALTCLALVRAIQVETKIRGGLLNHIGAWLRRVRGKAPTNMPERRISPRLVG